MAIYHFSAKVISRAAGSSALAAAAYRSASRLADERLGRDHDFTRKPGVIHSEVLLPDGAPQELADRERLWNAVEAGEVRKDAQLAREVEFAIPREMTQDQGVALARDFAQREFVDQGMVADLNVHWDRGADGLLKPHAHVMLTMREVGEEGRGAPGAFGRKVRDWNRTERLQEWRERWADHVNGRLAELDIDARIDHRSFADRDMGLEPQHKIGPAASRMDADGLASDRAEDHRRIARENGEGLIRKPSVALAMITREQATFTDRDLARFVHRHSDGKDQFDRVMSAVRASPELVPLGTDGRGEARFTSRPMLAIEARLELSAETLATARDHGVSARLRDAALAVSARRGLALSAEQAQALEHVTGKERLASVVGYAGSGKSAMLGVAREAWEAEGYTVRGAALSGIAAENLEGGSGIASRTLASLEHQWEQRRDRLTGRDVLVIDEAGMIGSRQMERVLSHAREAGAKVVLVGDPEQLQAIEAGAAFRAVAQRHGAVEITEVRRQREDWQRDATHDLATGRTGEALEAYDARGAVHAASTREEARRELIERWDRERQAAPDATRIILTHTNAEVRELNDLARSRLRGAGELGEEVRVGVERGERGFASGDRVMFLKNERSLGVKNGTLGVLEQASPERLAVRLNDGRQVAFDLKDYAHLDHGYAATVHKAQGVTVDRAHVLATPGMDRHAAYVAMSRHRDRLDLHYGRDDFADRAALVRTLSRDRAKDMASDYELPDPAQAYAERRGITFRAHVAEIVCKVVPEKVRGIFDSLRLPVDGGPAAERSAPERKVAQDPETALRHARTDALVRHARAVDAMFETWGRGGEASPEQVKELQAARKAFEKVRPYGSYDAEAAYRKNPELAREAASGPTSRAIRALQLETELRTNPERRADRFVERWRDLDQTRQRQYQAGDMSGFKATRDSMGEMARSLERDPQLESILEARKSAQLGIGAIEAESLTRRLAMSIGFDLGRGRGLGL